MEPAVQQEASRASLRELLAELKRLFGGGARRVRLHGCDGSLLALVAAQLAADTPADRAKRPLVVIARDGAAAQALHRDLGFFLPERPPAATATATATATGGPAADDPARPPRVMLLPELET